MPTYAEDNPYPYITLVETADPSTPAANVQRMWLDTDGVLKVIDETATVMPVIGTTVTDATISTSDVTTNNASTSKHGWLKKLSNVATEYMDGTGAWSVPAGSGGGGPVIDYSTLASNTGISSSSWGAVATATDNVVAAVAGDLVEVSLWCRIESGGSQFFQDVYSMVGGSPVNSLGLSTAAPSGTSGVGVLPWVGDATSSFHPAGSVFYVVQSGDLSGGNITCRWYARAPSGTGTISGGSRFDVKNWGQ